MEPSDFASVNSTKNGRIYATVLSKSRRHHLLGSLCVVDTDDQQILCQVRSVDTTNPVHENPLYGPLITELGKIEHLSGESDVEIAVLDPIACVSRKGKLEGRKANPASGTGIRLVAADNIEQFEREKKYRVIVGHLYGYPDVPLSVVCKHFDFDSKEPGGYGEALHTLVAGQTGSGKTYWSQLLLACRLSSFPSMGCLIPDTKGDFVRRAAHQRGEFFFDFGDLVERAGRNVTVVPAEEIKLVSRSRVIEAFARHFPFNLGQLDNVRKLTDAVFDEFLGDRRTVDKAPTYDEFIELCKSNISEGWATKSSQVEKSEKLDSLKARRGSERQYSELVSRYLQGQYSTYDLVERVCRDHDIVILNLLDRISPSDVELFMTDIVWQLNRIAKRMFSSEELMNAIIVIDEAPRWVGQASDTSIKKAMVDSINTTRAYGLSWNFITQRLAAIDKDVLAQCTTQFFGKGLSVGADRHHLENLLGKEGCELYDNLDLTGDYFFVGTGLEMNLGSGRAIGIVPFGENVNEEIMTRNPHIWRRYE